MGQFLEITPKYDLAAGLKDQGAVDHQAPCREMGW